MENGESESKRQRTEANEAVDSGEVESNVEPSALARLEYSDIKSFEDLMRHLEVPIEEVIAAGALKIHMLERAIVAWMQATNKYEKPDVSNLSFYMIKFRDEYVNS